MEVSERSSKTMRRPVRAVSAKESADADHASHAALRPLIVPPARPCSLVPSLTTPLYSTTVSQALRQTLRGKGLNDIDPHHQPRAHCGPGDREVRDKSLLTSFNIDGERTSDTL